MASLATVGAIVGITAGLATLTTSSIALAQQSKQRRTSNKIIERENERPRGLRKKRLIRTERSPAKKSLIAGGSATSSISSGSVLGANSALGGNVSLLGRSGSL